MSLIRAVALVDHQTAQISQFDADHEVTHTATQKLHAQLKLTRQHASGVRTEHEFFAEVCDALEATAQVLVVGGHTGLADFRHYLEKHRPLTVKHIVGFEVVDHPTENQLVALARKYFIKYDQMGGNPAPP